jgi:SNF2 family DNA or RNA helicase
MSFFATLEAQVQNHVAVAATKTDRAEAFRAHSDAVAPTAGWVLPVAPQGITLHSYQAAAVETLIEFDGGILGFAPGMGKTAVALAAAAAWAAQGKRSVIVVPPSLRVDWERAANRFFPHLTVEVVAGQKPAALPACDLLIIGDSVLAHRQNDVIGWAPAALIVDEAQRHKNPKAKRSLAALAISQAVRSANGSVTLLTGTLAVNNPQEVWFPTRITGVAAQVSGDETLKAFLKRWCATEEVWTGRQIVTVCAKEQDPSQMAQLHERLRHCGYIRVERDQVLDLPSKVWAPRALELNGSLSTYRAMERNFLSWVASFRGDAAALRAARAEAITKMMALWAEAGSAKIGAVVEHASSLVEQDEQVVIMAWHSKVVTGIVEALEAQGISTAKVVGGMTSEAKTDAQDKFRSGQVKVIVCNIVAGGTGLNLEASAHLIFAQLPWSAGDLTQASDRVYRLTSTRGVTIHVDNAADTIDERMFAVLAQKAIIVDQINTGSVGATMDIESAENAVLASFGFV